MSKEAGGYSMAVYSADTAASTWNPSRYALWSQRWGDYDDDRQNYPTAIVLRHPTAPYVDVVDEITDEKMQAVAYAYLELANSLPQIVPALDIPPALIKALGPSATPDLTSFRWLPIEWPPRSGDSQPRPVVSFQAMRHSDPGDSVLPDQTVIMLATRWLKIFSFPIYYGFEFGIRIVVHVLEREEQGYEIRITGMSASLPFGRWRYLASDGIIGPDFDFSILFGLFDRQVRLDIADATGLARNYIQIPAVRFGGKQGTERLVVGTAPQELGATPYQMVFAATPGGPQALVTKVELVADAQTPGHAWVFPRDPASQPEHDSGEVGDLRKRRPTRSKQELDCYRYEAEITEHTADPLVYPPRPDAVGPAHPSADDVDDSRVEGCPAFVPGDGLPGQTTSDGTKVVYLPGTRHQPHPRTNDFSAVSAEYNFAQFFERLEAYGLDAHEYFLSAKLPLKVFYRSGIRPGPGKNGQTVNARVMVEGEPAAFEGPDLVRPFLQVHLALADLSTRSRKPWNRNDRSPAEPLGIAADPRWIWHELGHVLLMASTGELQFRFAHSAGDALAAIVGDPQSVLATDRNWRGATFPWVFLPRRHDRCVSHGWSWTGQLHRDLAQVELLQGPRRKGYWSEQILSSSLFRLYRCIGGDTTQGGSPDVPDKPARESASHYCTYLIMRGIQLLGTTYVVPAYEPDQFVSALIDADIGTGAWEVTFPVPPDAPKNPPRYKFHRVGGCVHKVIRWAFEAQGLYGALPTLREARGIPPPVDIFIKDLRPPSDAATCGPVEYGPGSYVPVSLDWSCDQSESDPPPAWQADPNEGIISSDDGIYVKVGNRGSQTAEDVTVSVWWCPWPADTPPPKWNGPDWEPYDPPESDAQDILPNTVASFGPFSISGPSPSSRYVVLAQATCDDDPANTIIIPAPTPTAILPCGREETCLLDLVANDNNLGLRVF
jgi:hypothetical protein